MSKIESALFCLSKVAADSLPCSFIDLTTFFIRDDGVLTPFGPADLDGGTWKLSGDILVDARVDDCTRDECREEEDAIGVIGVIVERIHRDGRSQWA